LLLEKTFIRGTSLKVMYIERVEDDFSEMPLQSASSIRYVRCFDLIPAPFAFQKIYVWICF
jgi:hypothetical protein